ncbi:MAG: hypothetical protein QHH14_07150 [Clostridiales bacterium]|nr:hypothetical protein [Clostridiales bacterium]
MSREKENKKEAARTSRKKGERRPGGLSLVICFLFSLAVPCLFSQTEEGREPAKSDALAVFLDCAACDPLFIQREVPFALFVLDPGEAQVVVLVSVEKKEGQAFYTMSFRGQNEFEGDNDQLIYSAREDALAEEINKGLLQTLKMGLMRYAGKTPVAQRLMINFQDQVKPTAAVDPWNFWVFSLSVNCFLSGEQSYRSSTAFGSFSANRLTPNWKIRLAASAMYRRDRYTYEDLDFESSSDSQSFRGLVVKSLNDHWSLGAFFSLSSSTYSNLRVSATPAPAVEFNLFPYSESTKKQLRFLYRLNFKSVRYREETIYLKTRENLWQQALSVTLELVRPWGTVSTSLEAANYLHDFRKNHFDLWGDISLRIIKGFNFNIHGSYSRIHDQLSLPRMGASLEEVLLQRKQLATTYDYFFSVGLSYSFGSVRSTVVNPRFGDGGGGISMRISM